MSFPTFTPALQPSVGSGWDVSLRMITNQFGDGYRQTAPDGLNTFPFALNLTWNSLEVSDADFIEGFFVASNGTPFWWQKPRDSLALLWDCTKWSRRPISGGQDMITATFNQRFDLG